jgi:hypothetical protein
VSIQRHAEPARQPRQEVSRVASGYRAGIEQPGDLVDLRADARLDAVEDRQEAVEKMRADGVLLVDGGRKRSMRRADSGLRSLDFGRFAVAFEGQAQPEIAPGAL